MAKCKRCKKGGLFTKTNAMVLCARVELLDERR